MVHVSLSPRHKYGRKVPLYILSSLSLLPNVSLYWEVTL